MIEPSYKDSLILITKLRTLHDCLYSSGSKNDEYSAFCVDKIEEFLREYDRGLINYKCLHVMYIQISTYAKHKKLKRDIYLLQSLMDIYIQKKLND